MNQKTRYNDTELAEFEKIIDSKIAKAQDELNYYLKGIKDLAENEATKLKGLDDATGAQESEQLQTMAARQTKMINHLEQAKVRIKKKVYGVCRESGKLISKARLKAVPHATLSIEAKQSKIR